MTKEQIIITVVCVIAGLLLVGFGIWFCLHLAKKNKIQKSEEALNQKIDTATSKLALSFGGKENIKSIQDRSSRVSVEVFDMEKVNKDEIMKELEGVMFMGSKIVFVIGSKSEEFKKLLEEKVEK